MKTNISTIALALITAILLLATPGLSQAQHGDHIDKFKPRVSMPPYPHLEKLGLNEEQLKKIKDVHFELKKKQIEINSKIKIDELELRKMMMDDAPEKEINKKIDKIADQKGKMRKLHTSSHFEIKKTLTDDQWQSFKKSMHGKRSMGNMHDMGHKKMKRNSKLQNK